MRSRKRLGKTENQYAVWLISLFVLLISIVQPSIGYSAMVEPKEKGNRSVGETKLDRVPGEVLVKFKQNVLPQMRAQFHGEANAEVLSTVPILGIHRVKAKSGESTEILLERYRKNPFVEYAEPNLLFQIQLTPNDPRFGDLYGLHNTGQSGGTIDADVDAPEAWDIQTGSNSVIVADIDTGVDHNHADLAANIWSNPGETAGNGIDDDGNGFIDDVRGWNFIDNNNNPIDDYGHGTHTVGTIAAVGNNGIGVAGVSWQSKIMAVKVCNSGGGCPSSAIANGILYASQMGAKISNNSYGCTGSNCFSQVIEDAIAIANSRGMLFVVAAGNANNNNDGGTPTFPCNSTQPNVICVAATDRNDARAGFSNFGATSVDLGAPGVAVVSTVPTGSCTLCDATGYLSLNGTSMATPHVAGAAALILSQFPTSTTDQLKSRVLSGVDSIAAMSGITVTGGRLNVNKAIRAGSPLNPPTSLTAVDRPADSGGAINLAWTPTTSTGITQQRVYRATTTGGPYSLIITFNNNTTNSHTDTGITNGTRYFYVVRAFNGTVESANSNEASAVPANNTDTTPPVISNVTSGNITTSGATITWTTNEASDSQVEYGITTSYGSSSLLNPTLVTSHSVTISNLLPATLYHYRVKSRDAANNLATSGDFTFTTASSSNTDSWATKASLPSATTGLAAGVINGTLYAVGGGNTNYSAALDAYNPATNSWSAKASMSTARVGLGVGVINGILYAVGGFNLTNSWLTTLEAYDPATNTWSTKAAMPTPRTGLGVGVVNGILYAIGGTNQSVQVATVEAYNPATNTWSTKASMPTARGGLAVEVINGIIYAVGGTAGGSLVAVEAYDPATNTWSTKASLPAARSNLAAGVANGLLYAVGGSTAGVVGTLQAYDPATNSWSTRTSMPTARQNLAAGVVNGLLYALGGDNGSPTKYATVEVYTPSNTDSWATKASLPSATTGLAAGVINGTLYAVGGGNTNYSAALDAYNPATNSWSAKASMSTARVGLGVGVINGILYAVGGFNLTNSWLTTLEAYDPATNTWSTKAAMPTPRSNLGVGVINGILYAVGGSNQSTPVATVEAYNPATNTWSTKASMPTARIGVAVGVVNGILYAIGGNAGSGGVTTVEAYDPATNTWSTKASMPTARSNLAAGVANGLIYAVGGLGSGALGTMEAYNPATNSWSTKAPMPTARQNLAAGVVNGLLYALGGDNGSPTKYATVEVYTPSVSNLTITGNP